MNFQNEKKSISSIADMLCRSKITVIGGRPGIGKTSLMLNIASYLIQTKHMPIYIFTLAPIKAIIKEKFVSTASQLSYFLIYEDFNSIEDIKQRIKTDITEGIIFIDFLQLVTVESNQSKRNNTLLPRPKQNRIVYEFKSLSQEKSLPIVLLSSVKRDIELRQNNQPTLNDVLYSKALVQNSDLVIFLYRTDYYHSLENSSETEIIVAKSRFDNNQTLKMKLDKNTLRFTTIS